MECGSSSSKVMFSSDLHVRSNGSMIEDDGSAYGVDDGVNDGEALVT